MGVFPSPLPPLLWKERCASVFGFCTWGLSVWMDWRRSFISQMAERMRAVDFCLFPFVFFKEPDLITLCEGRAKNKKSAWPTMCSCMQNNTLVKSNPNPCHFQSLIWARAQHVGLTEVNQTLFHSDRNNAVSFLLLVCSHSRCDPQEAEPPCSPYWY